MKKHVITVDLKLKRQEGINPIVTIAITRVGAKKLTSEQESLVKEIIQKKYRDMCPSHNLCDRTQLDDIQRAINGALAKLLTNGKSIDQCDSYSIKYFVSERVVDHEAVRFLGKKRKTASDASSVNSLSQQSVVRLWAEKNKNLLGRCQHIGFLTPNSLSLSSKNLLDALSLDGKMSIVMPKKNDMNGNAIEWKEVPTSSITNLDSLIEQFSKYDHCVTEVIDKDSSASKAIVTIEFFEKHPVWGRSLALHDENFGIVDELMYDETHINLTCYERLPQKKAESYDTSIDRREAALLHQFGLNG